MSTETLASLPDNPLAPRLRAYGRSSRGRGRPNNEDHFLVASLERIARVHEASLGQLPRTLARPQGMILGVADGIGRGRGGELAGAVAIAAMLDHTVGVLRWQKSHELEAGEALLDDLEGAISGCGVELARAASARYGAGALVGTTLTFAYVSWPDAYVNHVGDSRCYLLREGALRQVTRDQTLGGQIRDAGGPALPHLDHVLVGSIASRGTPATVESRRLTLCAGDRLLLCTDGVHGAVPGAALGELLLRARSPADASDAILAAAHAGGSDDDATAVVAFF